MRNYDFHELLSFDEFQKFATELISIRDNTKLRCNTIGRDDGIDFYSLDNKIIGQVKNYKNNFSQLKNSLSNEIERVKSQDIKRYILVTSTSCTKRNKDELVSLFGNHLKFDDIIDKNEINLLLSDPKYNYLETQYLKLLVPNSFVLSNFLDKIQYRNIYTQSEIELRKIKDDQKIFSANELFFDAQKKLLKNKNILISGEAGIGKSTFARMLSAYLINSNPQSQFICIKSIDELYQMYNNEVSQIYLFDDFWGDIKYNFQINSIQQKKLLDFMEYISLSDNKWLILTTREYILKEGIQYNEQWRKKYLANNFSMDLKNISTVSKFNILYNHLKITDLSWEHLNIILRFWKNIIDNPNYNPRLVETFFDNYQDYKDLDDFDFFKQFENYLYSPFDYWSAILKKQSFFEIVILILISLSDQDVLISDIRIKFSSIINSKKLERDIEFNFSEYIKKMEDTFITTKLHDDKLVVNFKNPSYRDFIIDYFSRNVDIYIPYVFNDNLTTDELINLWNVVNKNFNLYCDLSIIKDLDNFLVDKITGTNDIYHLIDLANKTNFDYTSNIKKDLISAMEGFLQDAEDYIYANTSVFHSIILLLHEMYDKYDFSSYIANLIDVIVDNSYSFNTFRDLVIIKELYPTIFNPYFKEYRGYIRKRLISCALEDAFYYQSENDPLSIELLMTDDIVYVFDELNIMVPKKLLNDLENILNNTKKVQTEDYEEVSMKSYDNSFCKENDSEDLTVIDDKIRDLIGNGEYIDSDNIIMDKSAPLRVKKIFNNILKENIDIYDELIHYKSTLDLMTNYFINNKFSNDIDYFFDSFIKYIRSIDNLSEDDFFNICLISVMLSADKKVVFTVEDVKNYLSTNNVDIILNSSFFIKRGKWYHFINPFIQLYLFISSARIYDKLFKLEYIVSLTQDYSSLWNEVDYYDFQDISVYKFLKVLFYDLWHNSIEINYFNEYLNSIDSTNELSIAKSMLKVFSLNINYNIDESFEYATYDSWFLMNLIIMNFNVDIVDLFNFDNINENDFLDKFIRTHKTIEVNRYLSNKKFIDLLIKNRVIEILNNLYNDLKKFINN